MNVKSIYMRFFFFLFFCINSVVVIAQAKHYTLEQCIQIALQNNLEVNRAANQAGRETINRRQAWLNMLPDLNGSAGHYWLFGRGIDNTTNTYVDRNFYSGNYGISGDAALFQGLALQNSLKQAVAQERAAKMSWQQQQDALTLNTILAYLQLMNFEDMLQQNSEQALLSAAQVKRLKNMDAKGAIAPSELFDVQGQFSGEEAAIISARRNVTAAKINICALMNIPFDTAMVFERMPVTELLVKNETDAGTAYSNALKNFAEVKVADYLLQGAAYKVKATRGRMFPYLGFGYGLGSNYTQSGIAVWDQLKNNTSKNLGVFLSVPIFNNLQQRNLVRLAKLDLKDAELQNTRVKTALQQDVEMAYSNMNAAHERYQKFMERVSVLEQSYQAAEARFTVGQWNSIEYLTVKNNLDRAKIDMIGGKYEYLLRVKIFNYYQGITTPN